ncbi:MAG TPA: hypothetical protein PKD34_00140 [Candidatus Doudnabacteria bacterium]|nr:hypothetical protein [Candidatus Doudnabacteria bacterium]
MQKIFRVLVLASFFVAMVSAVGFSQALPAGTRMLPEAEKKSLIEQYERGEFAVTTSSPTRFTFMMAGYYRVGATVYARNSTFVKSEVTVIGVRRYPNAPAQYLQAMQIAGSVLEGVVWYALEEGKKALWNEDGGIVTYEALVFSGGSVTVFRTERDYSNHDAFNRAHRFITGGNSVYDSNGNLTIYLFGNFSGQVSVIIRNENGWEWAVPPKAINSNQFMVTINMSAVPYFEKYGDIQIAIANGDRTSDQYTMRINRFNSNLVEKENMLHQKIMETYSPK